MFSKYRLVKQDGDRIYYTSPICHPGLEWDFSIPVSRYAVYAAAGLPAPAGLREAMLRVDDLIEAAGGAS